MTLNFHTAVLLTHFEEKYQPLVLGRVCSGKYLDLVLKYTISMAFHYTEFYLNVA
jgi:hypothetical protein